jgi:hypothetical protein
MGAYGRRGVEYRIVKEDGNIIIIVEEKDADSRLLNCEYYLSRKASWFFEVYRKGSFCVGPIHPPPVDLYEHEKERLKKELSVVNGKIIHGWYDVATTTSTLNGRST